MLTCEEIDKMHPDDNEATESDRPDLTNRYWRHLMFAKFVLGESLKDAYFIAYNFRETPLPVAAMHHLADHWQDDEYDGPSALEFAGLDGTSPVSSTGSDQ